MFDDLLANPMEALPFFTFLVRQLCGKNRFRYAKFVGMMIQNQYVKSSGPEEGLVLTLAEIQANP